MDMLGHPAHGLSGNGKCAGLRRSLASFFGFGGRRGRRPTLGKEVGSQPSKESTLESRELKGSEVLASRHMVLGGVGIIWLPSR